VDHFKKLNESRSNFLRTPDGTAEASTDDAKMRGVEAVKPPVSFADLQRMPDDGNRRRSIEVSRLNPGGYCEPLVVFRERCASSVVAGFEIELDELFADGLAI